MFVLPESPMHSCLTICSFIASVQPVVELSRSGGCGINVWMVCIFLLSRVLIIVVVRILEAFMLKVGSERRKCAKRDPSHLVVAVLEELIVLGRKAGPKRRVVNVIQ